MTWLRALVGVACRYSGAIKAMVAALADDASALHASCVAMKASGTRLLTRAQTEGTARGDLDGGDLFALVGALAWICDQPDMADRTDRLFNVVADGLLA